MERRKIAERRDFPRIVATFKLSIAFSGVESEGSGRLVNLSHGGCAIHSSKTVEQGAFMLLHIHPPEGDPLITIETAEVKWIDGDYFGLEFLEVVPEEEERLQGLLHLLRTKYNVPV